MDVANLLIMVIAIADWHGNVSPVFDVSDRLCVVEMIDGAELRREARSLRYRDPFGRAGEVAGTGAEVLICGAVSHVFETALINARVQVLAFICGNIDSVIDAFAEGRLSDSRFFMPGCFGKGQGYRFQHRRGRDRKRR